MQKMKEVNNTKAKSNVIKSKDNSSNNLKNKLIIKKGFINNFKLKNFTPNLNNTKTNVLNNISNHIRAKSRESHTSRNYIIEPEKSESKPDLRPVPKESLYKPNNLEVKNSSVKEIVRPHYSHNDSFIMNIPSLSRKRNINTNKALNKFISKSSLIDENEQK